MEYNEITMCLDVKLDIYDKRPDSLKFKAWTKCQVKIEAIKCLPCFLRISFQSIPEDDDDQPTQLSVSVNVPGVTISLATSRFKQHSYGLFWTHNRRDCFIYFALDTEMGCRKHMKWIKKSIKNLELYRQVILEQRRISRGPGLYSAEMKRDDKKDFSAVKDALSALGPLPQIPDANNSFNSSRRVSRASEIYEEIYEGNVPPRLSRRLSRASIASGIYEEMKPCSPNIHSIVEEQLNSPPPLPPLPPHRKRLNTFELDPLGILGDIPRSNTTPESELAKKKKYRNVLDNILNSGCSKRSASVSETTACSVEDIINGLDNDKRLQHIYANDMVSPPAPGVKHNKRNSFSSPDLSKINFLDTFDEEKLAALMQINSSSDLDSHVDDDFDREDLEVVHNCSSLSLNEPAIEHPSSLLTISRMHALLSKSGSMESLNISSQLPQNFNFSACNTSSINLVGASGAVPSIQNNKRNNIIMEEELTGYCLMAPILSRKKIGQQTITTTTSSTTSSTTSGYSTGSYSSSTSSSSSSNTQATENKEQLHQEIFNVKKDTASAAIDSFYDELPLRKTPLPVADSERYNILETVQIGTPLNGSNVSVGDTEITPVLNKDFTGHLYENLLTIKAAQELEQPLQNLICTSTPTDTTASLSGEPEEQENFYQTPRKPIISIDDKIPSYYPNSCDTVKMRRRSISPSKHTTPISNRSNEKEKPGMGLKNLVNIKMKRERKENLYISSPQKILEQRKKSCVQDIATAKSKKHANAKKISENVYAVNLSNKKSTQLYNNNNNSTEKSPYNEKTETGHRNEKFQNELLQLALLQKIDFKFDDTSAIISKSSTTTDDYSVTQTRQTQSGIAQLEQAELEYENCYQATKNATRLLHTYATLAPKQSVRIKQQLQHHLQLNQNSNKKIEMTQSTKLESPITSSNLSVSPGFMGSKKFASLPRFKKIDFSPLKLKINNVLQRNQNQDF